MIGSTIGHYRIIDRLGEGGMGVVYKAEDVRLGRLVALKFLSSDHLEDQDAKRRFLQEAQSASQLDHPNICTVLDVVDGNEGRLCIAMPCYEGESLKQRIHRGPLGLYDAIDVEIQLLRGLAKAHASGIIHRDIKPANLFITTDGVVKILDFGLARVPTSSVVTRSGSLLGTLRYVSPEQIRRQEISTASDLWAAGVTLYEMLTGNTPFRGEYEAAVVYSILQEDPVPVHPRCPDLPDHVAKVIGAALQKDPRKRPACADVMIECLHGRTDCRAMLAPSSVAIKERAGFELIVMEQVITLADGEYLVGRADGVPISINASSVSRHHARIVIKDGEASIEDLGSKNGTWVGGTRIDDPTLLSDLEEISFGRVRAIFRSTSVTASAGTRTDSY